jgi:hypothetical protein
MPERLLRIWVAVLTRLDAREDGQTTAEYALVLIGAAAVAGLVLTWATKTHAISRLFDAVLDKVIPG